MGYVRLECNFNFYPTHCYPRKSFDDLLHYCTYLINNELGKNLTDSLYFLGQYVLKPLVGHAK